MYDTYCGVTTLSMLVAWGWNHSFGYWLLLPKCKNTEKFIIYTPLVNSIEQYVQVLYLMSVVMMCVCVVMMLCCCDDLFSICLF